MVLISWFSRILGLQVHSQLPLFSTQLHVQQSTLLTEPNLTFHLSQSISWIFFIFFLFFPFKTRFHCIALAVLELNLQTILALNSRDPPSSASQAAGIKDVHHHAQLDIFNKTFTLKLKLYQQHCRKTMEKLVALGWSESCGFFIQGLCSPRYSGVHTSGFTFQVLGFSTKPPSPTLYRFQKGWD